MSSRLVLCTAGALAALAPAALATPTPAPSTSDVIGGSDVPAGKWRDCAAVMFDSFQGCTGTLIAPDVVLTAGHCADPTLNEILVGTNDLGNPGAGETIAVAQQFEYPSSQTSEDVTILKLASASTVPPRAIATGWARLDIKNGAAVEFVGFGTIDPNGNNSIDQLQQAASTITDFDCTTHLGCNPAARPNGELGAGGGGIDTCPGDSGGPMYLLTSYGDFVAGVTSRAYDDATHACGEGGIYERPDKIVDWIESKVGPVSRGPEPTAAPLDAINGDAAETTITANDPLSANHTFAITTAPAHGTAAIDDTGRVRVCTDPTYQGADAITVTITDADSPDRALAFDIPITVEAGEAPPSCSLSFDDGGGAGGCCDSGHSSPAGAAVPLALVLGGLVRRRRNVRATA